MNNAQARIDYGFDPDSEEKAERQIEGMHDALDGKPRASSDPDYLMGYDYGVIERQNPVVVVPITRPEGYYHMPLGSFE